MPPNSEHRARRRVATVTDAGTSPDSGTAGQPSPGPTAGLNPAQQEVLDQLGAVPGKRPEFPAELRGRLRQVLDDGLGPLLADLDTEDTLFVSKHALGGVFGCERRFVALEDAPFEWTVPVARGTVAHKAIEILVHWRREPHPLTVVDEAIDRLTQGDDGLGDFLKGCTETERAELRAEANDRVVKFTECFPPLKTGWRPVTESRLRYEHPGGRLILAGKVDLTLGQPDGPVAGKVLIDLKTGGFSPVHREDLRFYALIEATRITPPRLVATYYLDQAKFMAEEVTEDLLDSAAARTIDGTERIIGLRRGGREPSVSPGPACRWCPVLSDCDTGRGYLDEDDSGGHGNDW